MAGFKEAGQFIPTQVPPEVQNGGVYYNQETSTYDYSVRHPNFRLRTNGDKDTQSHVSSTDIDPIKLQPSNGQQLRLPDTPQLKGIEAEFTIIDSVTGEPFDLYSNWRVSKNNGHVAIESSGIDTWLIDEIGLGPEALRWQGELAIKPATSWDELNSIILSDLLLTVDVLQERGLLLLPTGLSGEYLEKDWNNSATHTYITSIQEVLKKTALDFDACGIQSHNDLAPYNGGIEHGLRVANIYNPVYATMVNALATSAPFWKGEINGRYSYRENARNKLSTNSGVQADVIVDGHKFLEVGDFLIKRGLIPVPERAYGANKDTRPAKLTTGTFEAASPDMTGNIDFWIAQTVLNEHLITRFTKAQLNGEEIPSFLLGTSFKQRRENRAKTGDIGNRAIIATGAGELSINECWNNFFVWAEPNQNSHFREGWDKARETVEKMLEYPAPASAYGQDALKKYFDRKDPTTYLRGNLSEIMLTFASLHEGVDIDIIRLTNIEASKCFMQDLIVRQEEAGLR